MRLLSISSGKVAPLFGNHHPNYKFVASAIRKQSISNLQNPLAIEINTLGVQGDEQADLSVHGGLEKAIYVYPAEHYPFWNELLTRETHKLIALQYGAIGENFTIEGLLETEIFVGDRLQIGELEFSVVKYVNLASSSMPQWPIKGLLKLCCSPVSAAGIYAYLKQAV